MNKIIIIIALFLFLVACTPQEKQSGNLVATVNGEQIYQSEIDRELNFLQTSGIDVNESVVIEAYIQRKIMIQEAMLQDISVSDQEVQERIESLFLDGTATREEFSKYLEVTGETLAQFEQRVREDIMIEKLLNRVEIDNYILSKEEIEAFYNNTPLASMGVNLTEEIRNEIAQALVENRNLEAEEAYIIRLWQASDIQFN